MCPRRWKTGSDSYNPVRVQHANGGFVAYGTRAKAQAVGERAQVKAAADIELVIYNETGAIIRTIPGTAILDFPDQNGPVAVVVVDDSIETDPGDTRTTRG